MADYDYFYTFENFIGHTGDIQNNPTLYFMDNTHYGRITTQHNNPANVGRAAPKLLEGYTHGNRTRGGEVRLYERNIRLGKRHKSRNALTEPETGERVQVRARVLHLISVNTQVKAKDDEASREPHEFVPLDPSTR